LQRRKNQRDSGQHAGFITHDRRFFFAVFPIGLWGFFGVVGVLGWGFVGVGLVWVLGWGVVFVWVCGVWVWVVVLVCGVFVGGGVWGVWVGVLVFVGFFFVFGLCGLVFCVFLGCCFCAPVLGWFEVFVPCVFGWGWLVGSVGAHCGVEQDCQHDRGQAVA
ncbi:hypothetical protein, partial [Pseudomonas syringae group genomosp. 7]|uniref:hypothetical protein n=1 Tax=Pseudomonas syringae group genomosp. 7 TaxID=251699 RepID=UPI00376FA083